VKPFRGEARFLVLFGRTLAALPLVTAAPGLAAEPASETSQPTAGDDNAATSPTLDVDCTGLDVAETVRLLRVELAVIAARVERARAPSVRIECKKNVLHIEVKDPRSGGTKALSLPAPRVNTPDRERTIALAASQLFLSSWLEMITGKEPADEAAPRSNAPAPTSPPDPLQAIEADAGVESTEAPTPSGWELWASGALRFRHLGGAVRTLSPSLLLRHRFQRRWLVDGLLGAETAETARTGGDIDWFAASAGAALGVRAGSTSLFVDTLLSASLLLIRASGDPTVSGVRGDEREAAAFDLALHLAPALAFSRFRLGLIGQLGYLAPNVTVRTSRDEPLSFDGAWAGVGLVIGGEIAE
jgi:hypothetical protein